MIGQLKLIGIEKQLKKTNIKHFVNVSVTVLNKHNQINRVTS